MDWIEAFYRQQGEWGEIYTGEVEDQDRERAATIERLAGQGAKRILELGAGGGQSAAAAADRGHDVVAVELVPRAAANARRLAAAQRAGTLTVVEGNFYDISLDGSFDVVCYWDGFGVGSDADQCRLLRRVASWLSPSGRALIDISTPWFWAHAAGQEMRIGTATRRYGFDGVGCRMLDRWWKTGDESTAIIQSLRCYSPQDLRLLLEGTGLRLESVEPGGMVDHATGRWQPVAPLEQAMVYTAVLVHADGADSG